jgi:hypothetical protein
MSIDDVLAEELEWRQPAADRHQRREKVPSSHFPLRCHGAVRRDRLDAAAMICRPSAGSSASLPVTSGEVVSSQKRRRT